MSATAFQTQYRQEFVAGLEQRKSFLASVCTNEAVIKGNTATFLVADSGVTTTAVTRGVNGLIPARSDNLNQFSATLQEWHDLVRKTGFNVFASQGDQRRIMQETTMAVLNRKIDADIISQFDTATNTTGATGVVATLALFAKGAGILGRLFVDLGDTENLFAAITPAAWQYLMQVKEFASVQYVDSKPFTGKAGVVPRWMGFNWIVHPNLTGAGTSTETCYMFHRSAVGHAIDTTGLSTPVGYNEEQDYSYARATIFMGSKLLQQGGIVQVVHDGSAI